MWVILNWLFGWDYVCWKNSAASGIAKVHTSPDGEVYYWRYKSIALLDILPPELGQSVVWLTCKPEKYIK